MPVLRIAVLSFVAALALNGPASAQSAASGGLRMTPEGLLNRYGLTRAWWGHAVINRERDKLLYMVVDETRLFLQASSGVVSAFDAETGRALWTKQFGATDRAVVPASSNDELLFI